MPDRYDAIVIGLGGMGSAALAHLALRGRRVLGLEQFDPVHALGSSHGQSRIIRQTYFEGPDYVPLLLRAYELWSDLEKRSGRRLFLRTGGLMAGTEGCEVLVGSARSAREHGLPHEELTAAELRRRFPAFRPLAGEAGLYEPNAGVLFPEEAVRTHLEAAAAAGAETRFRTPVREWDALPSGGVRVGTAAGESFHADRLVITAGAWFGALAPELEIPLRVERNVLHFFDPAPGAADLGPGALPIYILQREGKLSLYGFPELPGQGMKAAYHHTGVYPTPETVDRQVGAHEVEAVRSDLAEWLPQAAGRWRSSAVCFYTNTPDENFVIGLHPHWPQVALAGGFSGHGFKFCSVVGEVLADLATRGETAHPIGLFSPQRFSAQ